jgi:oligopeptide transport system substrate-binding protein
MPILSRRLFFGAAFALAACGGQGGGAGRSEARVLHRGNTGEPLSLDPHKASGIWENVIIGDMFMGLFTESPAGDPIPGLADSWTVSEDGLVWTFKLRETVWSDGMPVTADDFVYSLRRILDPATLAQYASLLFLIKNAEPVNNGDMTGDQLGVRAIDPQTLEITLEHPAPYLPGLLTHYTSFPIPAHIVREHGDAWIQPENIQVNGAYKLVEWRSNDFVHVIRNELFFDNANVCLDEVYYYPTPDTNTAERRVRSGELDLNTDFPGTRIDFFRQEIPEYVHVHPFLMTGYLSFNMTREPFNDPRVRHALSMAIDRDFIVNEVLKDGRLTTYALVPPGIANYPGGARTPWQDQSMEQRRTEARRLLEQAGFGPDRPLRFQYTHRNTRDNPKIAPVLQSDWRQIAPWVEVDISGMETQIHYANLRVKNFEVADGGWVADYNDAQNFLYLFETRSGPMNYPGYSNAEYDDLVARSAFILDPEERASLLLQAEQILLEDAPIAPLFHEVNRNLVNPRVTGWVDNAVDTHRTRYLCFTDLEQAGASGAAPAE